ncbi:MAG: ThuA domain-containing protein [Pirellulaceae bacterium]
MTAFQPQFKDYDVVVSNYNGEPWSAATNTAFVEYVKGGGGFACVHAADNSFPAWPEYNQMIGVEVGADAPKKMAHMCVGAMTSL